MGLNSREGANVKAKEINPHSTTKAKGKVLYHRENELRMIIGLILATEMNIVLLNPAIESLKEGIITRRIVYRDVGHHEQLILSGLKGGARVEILRTHPTRDCTLTANLERSGDGHDLIRKTEGACECSGGGNLNHRQFRRWNDKRTTGNWQQDI